MKMRSKSFPVSSSRRKSLEPYQSRNPITNFEVMQNSVVSDACVVCEVSDKRVSSCSGIDCFLSFHQECLDAELDSSEEEGLANPYCPYCCFNTLALREYASLSGDDYNGYSDSETDEYYTGTLQARDEVEASDDETRVNTSLSGGGDDNECSVTEIISDQELQGDEDDACYKDTSLYGHDDDNGYSVDTTEIVSDQEELQGDGDDACSSKVLLDNDAEKSNMTLVEEQVIEEGEASEEETTEIISDQELQGEKDSDKSNMPLVEETDPKGYNSGNRRRILKAISEISSNESANKQTGEDVTQVAKSKTVRDISSSNKDQRRRILWTSEEEEMLKDKRFGSGVSTTAFDKRNVPHKKRHYLVTASRGSEMLHNSVPNKCVSGLFGLGCLVSFHEESLNAELGSSNSSEEEDPANSYCPYCWFHILAARYKAVVGSEIADFEYTNLSCDDDNEYSLDTTEIVSDQELRGDNDDACSSKGEQVHVDKDTSLSGDDDNGYSVDTTEIVSGQELQGDEDDVCSSTWEQMQGDKDSDQSNIALVEETDPEEEQVIDEVEALEVETAQDKASVNATVYGDENGYIVDTTEIISDQELQGDKDDACSTKGEQVQVNHDSDKSNMPIVEETDSEEYYSETLQVESLDDETGQDQTRVNRCAAGEGDGSGKENDQVQPNENRRQRRRRRRRRRRIALEAIDSEVSSNESTNVPTGEDVTQVPKSKTVRDISVFFNKNQRRRILWTSEEVEMLKVGVAKFAAEVKLNIPWRKILEMGKNVFHETRNPDSLKDKWRNMIRAS